MAEPFAPDYIVAADDGRLVVSLKPPRFVTETQAQAVLAELRPWLRERPPFDQFWKSLEMTVERTQAILHATIYGRGVAEAYSQVRRPGLRLKMYFISDRPASGALSSGNAPEGVFSMVLQQQRPRKGPAPRTGYAGFVGDLAKIAEGIGIKVTTAGNRTDDPHATPFTRFVFAVERLLPRKEQSPSLAACAKRIDRAIAISPREIGEAIARSGKRRNPAGTRLRDK
jgi:hypothetical protein